MAGYKNKKNTNKVEEELIQNSGIKKKVSTPKESKKDSETFLKLERTSSKLFFTIHPSTE